MHADAPTPAALVMAGVPAVNNALYHRIRFAVGDPAALIELPRADGRREAVLILRDIEMDRARRKARADRVACPADFAPAGGLSGDREEATAQAVAELLRREGVTRAVADRTLPLIFADAMREAGVAVTCDRQLGVRDRRAKDAQEQNWIRQAQRITQEAMRMACELVARAEARADGVLVAEGQALTAEHVRAVIETFLLERGFGDPYDSIVAGGAIGADPHDQGSGELRTGEPIIIDIFPRCRTTLYWGDCTRTVVHGAVPDEVARMHKVVVEAKAAAIAATRAGVTGETVHRAAIKVIEQHGYAAGPPGTPDPAMDYGPRMVHGTGHGVGLDIHEPPLLDHGGPELIAGDVVTIEPGLYAKGLGGVRVEDMVIVTRDGCENLSVLPEGLKWD